jgi:hypothetical protein
MDDNLSDEADERWCGTQRQQVLAYLSDEGFQSPSVGEWPAWHVAPIISVWAVESVELPGSVGWWAVSGDFPTDYTACSGARHPRQGLRDIGNRWQKAAARWADGQPADGFGLRHPAQEGELAPKLLARAQLFLDIAADDSNWEQ